MQSVEIRVRPEVAAAVRSLAEDVGTLRAWLLRSWLEDMAADHDDLPGKPAVIHYRSFAAAIPATTAAALRQLANTSEMTHFEFTSQAVQAVLAAGDLAVLPEDDAVPTEEHTLVTFGLRPGQREALQTRLGHERRGIATLMRAIARIYVGSHPMKEQAMAKTEGSSRRHTVRTLAMTGDPDLLDDVRSLAEDLDHSIASLVEDGLGLLVADAGRGPVRRIRPLAIRIAKGNPNTSIGMTEKGMALLQQVQTMYGGPQNGALLAASSRVVTQYLERSNDLDGSGNSRRANIAAAKHRGVSTMPRSRQMHQGSM